MSRRTIAALTALLCMAALTQAAVAMSPETLATFLDPGTTAFTFRSGTGVAGIGQLDGRNVDILLDIVNGPLAHPDPAVIEFPDASFVLTDSSGDWLDATAIGYRNGYMSWMDFEGGILEFYDDTKDPNAPDYLILGAVFESATMTPYSFGSVFAIGQVVDFYGPAATPQMEEDSFSFALVGVDPSDALEEPVSDFVATAAFTSSVLNIPEPSALVPVLSVFAMLGVGYLGRRRWPIRYT